MNDSQRDLEAALRGLDFPATRSKLITVARENQAPASVIERLLQFPETADFPDEDALERAIGIRVSGTHPHGWE